MGQHRHPDWLLNLRADPRASVLLPGRREVAVAAVELGADERAARWPEIERRIPQMRTYARRTRRDLPVVRLEAR
jgi:deazaflavin-dependent oxidoreductase (nitroreductase family)